MKSRSVLLAQFMPYGAPELLESASPNLTRALVTASSLGLVLFLAALWIASRSAFLPASRSQVVVAIPHYELERVRTQEPPPLARPEPPRPQPSSATKVNAVPVPKADAEVREDVTIPSQDEFQAPAPTAGAGNPAASSGTADAIPGINDYIYVDRLPQAQKQVVAEYPEFARSAQVEGLVMVRVLVDQDGRVREAQVVKSVPMLDTSALEAARRWTFAPATVNGHPIAVWVSIPFRFTLRG